MARLYDSEMGNRIDGRELNRNGDLSSDIVTRYFPVAEERREKSFQNWQVLSKVIYRAFRRHRFDSPRARLSINLEPHLEGIFLPF